MGGTGADGKRRTDSASGRRLQLALAWTSTGECELQGDWKNQEISTKFHSPSHTRTPSIISKHFQTRALKMGGNYKRGATLFGASTSVIIPWVPEVPRRGKGGGGGGGGVGYSNIFPRKGRSDSQGIIFRVLCLKTGYTF